MLAHAAPGNVLPAPPNKPLKPTRPGFGPAAEPPGPNSTSAVSRRLQISRCCPAVCAAAAVPRGIATWASAVQLTGMAVRRTNHSFRVCTSSMKLRVRERSTPGRVIVGDSPVAPKLRYCSSARRTLTYSAGKRLAALVQV